MSSSFLYKDINKDDFEEFEQLPAFYDKIESCFVIGYQEIKHDEEFNYYEVKLSNERQYFVKQIKVRR